MATFVLIGGLWTGAWVWRDTARRLRTLGHEVHALTLDGIAERRGAWRPEIDVDRHVGDVVDFIGYSELSDVVLVGHSYGGVVITAVPDAIRDRLARLIYVDSRPLAEERSVMAGFSPAARPFVEALLAGEGEGLRLPLPRWDDLERTVGASLAGIGAAGLARFRALATPHPAGTLRQTVRLPRRATPDLPKTAILNTMARADLRAFAAMSGPEWRFIEQPTSHWPMLSQPDPLADHLDAAAGGGGTPL